MTKDEILKGIGALKDPKDCSEIANAAKARGQALRDAAYKQAIKDYWARAVFFREGQTLYCNAEGTFIGGPLQRGDKCKVYRLDIDTPKPLIWISVKKKIYGFPPHELYRYRLLRTRPEKPIGSLERGMADKLSEIM